VRFVRLTKTVTVPAGATRDVVMPGQDRNFNDLTIWGVPAQAGPVVIGARYAGETVNVTGVTTRATTSPDGNGTLAFVAAGTLLSWQAPGAGAPGAAQDVHLGGTFVLDGGDGTTLTVDVTAGSLPGINQSDTIVISTTFPPARTRSFTSQVFYGPTAQGLATVRGSDATYLVYDPGDAGRVWAANEPTSSPQQKGTSNQIRGFPITVRIVNTAVAGDLVMTVEFVMMTIDQG